MSKLNLSNVKNTIAISTFFADNSIGLFTYPVDQQKAFLNKMGEAKDDYDRSYKQYLCQRQYQNKWRIVFLDFVFFFIYPAILIFFWIKGASIRKIDTSYDAIAAPGLTKLLPDELLCRYKISEDLYYKKGALRFKDVLFSLDVARKHPLSPLFVTKITLKMAYYCYMLRSYSPKAIIVMNEYSFTSSILTMYCEQYNVKHIDALHGEKLFYIRDSYFRYHECWIWDEHYRNLFINLKADPSQFRIAIPNSLKIDCASHRNDALYADYKYYLAKYSEDNLKQLVESMQFASKNGFSVKYRPHPIWSDLDLLRKYVNENEIEMPRDVSILDSIANLKYAVGSFSTVLYQAYCSGKDVVLDDVAFIDEYNKLASLDYILCKKGLPRLSELQAT